MNQPMKMMAVIERDHGLDDKEIERKGFVRSTIRGWLSGKHDPKVGAMDAFITAMDLDYLEIYKKALALEVKPVERRV